jgi:hypothetical protein
VSATRTNSVAIDQVGRHRIQGDRGVTALSNGNYVVTSPIRNGTAGGHPGQRHRRRRRHPTNSLVGSTVIWFVKDVESFASGNAPSGKSEVER